MNVRSHTRARRSDRSSSPAVPSRRFADPHRPSPALVIALIALFVSLGGTGYAAAKIGSAQIKNNSIQSKDIKNNQVAGRDVKNSSLMAKDFKAGQLPAGPQGAAGPTGATGPTGAGGAPGSARGYAHVRKDGTLDASQSKGVLGVSPPCSGSGGTGFDCRTGAREPDSGPRQCLKLTFTPKSAVVTPDLATLSGSGPLTAVQIPGRDPTTSIGGAGCGLGFRDVEVYSNDPSAGEEGFYVVFN